MSRLANGSLKGGASVDELVDAMEVATKPPSEREIRLKEIKAKMGIEFHFWYYEVYKLRAQGKGEEYEAEIKAKWEALNAGQNS